jgi:hypothetical protein
MSVEVNPSVFHILFKPPKHLYSLYIININNMKRKIIKQGSQAFTLTLPINWIRENNLSEQNQLELKQVGRSLIINAQSKPSGGSIKFDFNEDDERPAPYLNHSCYAQGIDEITITQKRPHPNNRPLMQQYFRIHSDRSGKIELHN